MDPASAFRRKSEHMDQAAHAMNFSYFSNPSQPVHSYMGLPPTPVHSLPNSSDEFSNGSGVEPYDFQVFDPYTQYNGSSLSEPQPPTPQSIHKPTAPASQDSFEHNGDAPGDQQQRQGSNSEDEDNSNMTPAQARRKAQNRAAQRAFRERKEKHVKELEARVAALQQSASTLSSENAALKLNLQKVSVENEILRATACATHNRRASTPSNSHSHSQTSGPHTTILPDTGPMRYSPREYAAFEDDILKGHEARGPTHRITTDPQTGDRLLAAGATWDYILGHELYREGKVDVERVSEVLRPLARCDGQGPVFREGDVERAVRGCVEG